MYGVWCMEGQRKVTSSVATAPQLLATDVSGPESVWWGVPSAQSSLWGLRRTSQSSPMCASKRPGGRVMHDADVAE